MEAPRCDEQAQAVEDGHLGTNGYEGFRRCELRDEPPNKASPLRAYHEVVAVSKADRPREIVADVVGNVCESGDVLASGVALPKLDEGDVLAIVDIGA